MTCPSCDRQNTPEARFCGGCGTPLSAGTPASWPAPPVAAPETRFTHPGKVYGLGYGSNFFGIWTLAGGPPVQTFDRTQAGWEAAWRRFQELELRDAVPAWRRATVAWVLLDIVVGFALWFLILIVEAAVLTAAKKETADFTDTSAVGALISLPMAVAGWLFFALARDRRARWVALAVLVGGGLAAALAFGLAGQPTR